LPEGYTGHFADPPAASVRVIAHPSLWRWRCFLDIEAAEEREDRRRNRPTRTELLDLYSECLAVVYGKRRSAG
jgi:hypothetical protein